MNNIFNYIFNFGPVIVSLILLIWMRCCCVFTENIKFPTRGHIVLITLLSAIPIIGIITVAGMIAFYIGFRVTGDLRLKSNRFTKFWFDIDE